MITNERQYRITCTQARRFELALVEFDSTSRDGVHPLLVKAERAALESQLADLSAELEEYERLKSADVSILSIASFDELPDGLIRARIASGLSQRELGEQLGLKEQQIQRYEAERYRSASYERLREVANALSVRIRNDILMPVLPSNFSELLSKLRQVGIDRGFLFSRLLPSADVAHVSEDNFGRDDDTMLAKVGAIIGRVFGWSPVDLFGPAPLTPPRLAAASARFKLPAWRSETSTVVYAAYASYLGLVVSRGSCDLPRETIPVEAAQMRAGVLRRYGDLTLDATLRYVWDLGVPVLPLRDRGTFHGACWRHEGRNVIVLKQTTKYRARWIFDLLHEVFHAGQQPEESAMEIIEADVTTEERRNSDQEVAASQFAGNVALDGRADELAQACVQAASGSVELFKAGCSESRSK